MKKSKFKKYIEYKSSESILAGLCLDMDDAFKTPIDAIKEKSLNSLINPPFLRLLGCIILTAAIYLFLLYETFMPIVCIPLLFFVMLFVEGVYTRIFKKLERWDPEHKVWRSVNAPYDDKRFMTRKIERQVFDMSKDINKYDGMILGKDDRGYMVSRKKNLDFGNEHRIIIGNSGTKKGVALVITVILQIIKNGISAVVFSTKDDNYSLLANIARAMGYKVWAFSLRPGEIEHSDAIDIIKMIKGRSDIAQTVAECVISNTSPGERPDYWYRGERSLLFALLMYFNMAGKTMKDLFEFLGKGLDYIQNCLDLMPENHPAYSAYMFFRGGERKSDIVKEQVIEGLGNRLNSFMADESMREIISHNEIDWDIFCKEKCLVFVVTSDKTPAYKALSSSFASLMFFNIGSIAEANGGTLDRPVEIIIDEAFACGPIQGYASLMGTARGYGINITTILQSIPQLQSMYPDDYKAILNDCGVKVLVHTDDKDTAQYFSDLAGTFTAENEAKDSGDNKTGSREASIPLLSVSTIMGMDINKMVVYISGVDYPTIILDKQLWYADWPGSTTPFYNKQDGKTYNSHPMLKYFKFEPLNKHTPAWFEEKNKLSNPQKEKNIKQVKGNTKFEFEEVTV